MFLQYGCEHMAGRAFAVGAGYMDSVYFVLGVIQMGTERKRICKISFIGFCARSAK